MEAGLPAEVRTGEVGAVRERAARGIAGSFATPLLTLFLLALALPVASIVWTTWTRDYRFGHGPLALVGSLYLLWQARAAFQKPDSHPISGKWLLGASAACTLGLLVLDVPTLLPLAWLGLLLGTVGYLRGSGPLRAAAPALGLLLFALPWPTPVLRGITAIAQAATLHLTALLAPLAGMPLERSGPLLTTTFEAGAAPYSVIVGPGCAGMKYLLALLSLAYFAARLDRMPTFRTLAFVAVAIPLALAANSLRILFILGFGAAYGPPAGDWAHDHLGLVAFLLPCVLLAAQRRMWRVGC